MRGQSFLNGGSLAGRGTRYAITLLIGWGVIMLIALSIFVLSPRIYTSGFTLILPGAGSSSNINIDSLGQATSISSSPFGGHSLSPTENYKRLLQSYRLRGRVANLVDLGIGETALPQIRLANQTKLMYITVSARSPKAAKTLAEAWLTAFSDEIGALRQEEQTLREGVYRSAIADYERSVQEAQAKIIAFQSEYGLISIEQYQSLVEKTESLRGQVAESITEAHAAESEVMRLSRLLGMSPDLASSIIVLLSDISFQELHTASTAANTKHAESLLIYGSNHPELKRITQERAGLENAMTERGRRLLGYARFESIEQQYFTANDERSQLISALVEASASLAGKRARQSALERQLEVALQRVADLAAPATELDALIRDHKVAETVFASALARADAHRTDMFASYPLVQTVEHPGLPSSPATPSKKFTLLGTIAFLFLYTIGLALLWLRLPLIRVLLKTL